jgi:hypothetical protein
MEHRNGIMNATVRAGRSEARELTADEISAVSGGEIKRSMPDGKTDIIKVPGDGFSLPAGMSLIFWMAGW